jgi:hypothetical protein
MDRLNKRIGAVGAAFIFGGFLLMFGAVGGMDDPTKADMFWAQVATALIGAMWAWVGTRLLRD